MPGFDSGVMFADNVDFTGTSVSQGTAQVTANGQLLIGSASAPQIRVGTLTSTGGTITITNGPGTINLDLAGGSTAIDSIIPDTGTSPVLPNASGAVSIIAHSGSKTLGGTNSLTVQSPPYSDQGGSTTVTLNSGSFATAAITLTLPASAGLADGDLFEFTCTSASALVIQSVGAQKIRIGAAISSAAGTATSNAIGDSLSLRFRAADGFFYATSVIGTWTTA